MTQNPFDALGGAGGFDMSALLAQSQQMQDDLAKAHAELADTVVEGSVSGGAVVVRISGVGDLLGLEIKPGTFDGDSTEDLADLSDLVVAAFRDAKASADARASATLGPLAGGGLPGLG